jgi:hypothetical protein
VSPGPPAARGWAGRPWAATRGRRPRLFQAASGNSTTLSRTPEGSWELSPLCSGEKGARPPEISSGRHLGELCLPPVSPRRGGAAPPERQSPAISRAFLGAGGGTRTPDTRIMISRRSASRSLTDRRTRIVRAPRRPTPTPANASVFFSGCSFLGVRFLVFVFGGERAAAPPPAPIWLHAWAFEEGGSTASRWTPLPRPARKTGQGSPGVVEVGRMRGGGKAGEVGSELRTSKEDKVRE